MTHINKLRELLKEFGVIPTEHIGRDEDSLILESGDVNVGGHTGFSVDFDFDKRGKFKKVNVWE